MTNLFLSVEFQMQYFFAIYVYICNFCDCTFSHKLSLHLRSKTSINWEYGNKCVCSTFFLFISLWHFASVLFTVQHDTHFHLHQSVYFFRTLSLKRRFANSFIFIIRSLNQVQFFPLTHHISAELFKTRKTWKALYVHMKSIFI